VTLDKTFYIAFERFAIMIASGSVGTMIYAWWPDQSPDWSIPFSWPFMFMIALSSVLTFFKHYGEKR